MLNRKQDFILYINKFIFFFLVFLTGQLFADVYYESREWKNLLYYKKTGENAYVSSVDDDRFFLSDNGKFSPKEEYEANLKKVAVHDEAFRKQFPLRYKRIVEHANLEYKPLVFPDDSVKSLVFAFPNRYMANPSSMFGHLFIVLKSEKGLLDSDLVHYIADVSSAESGFYLYNGLNGKFSGRFLQEPYYAKIKDYNYVEDRLVTYFDLSLPLNKVVEFQLHLKELESATFDYFFINENCAFFTGKLLNVVTETNVMSNPLAVLPSDLVNTMRYKGLFENEYFRQPSTKLFNQTYINLNREQKKQVLKLSSEIVSDEESYADLDVLETFLHTSEYLINTRPNDSQTVRHNRVLAYKALREVGRSNVRPAMQRPNTISPINSKGARLKYGSTGRFFFSYHPIFYNSYDFDDFEKKTLGVFSPRVMINSAQKIQLDFNLVTLENITQYNRILKNNSWKINSFFAYRNRLTMHHSAQFGRSFAFKSRTAMTIFAGANFADYNTVTEQEIDDLALRSSVSVGFSHYFSSKKMRASTAYARIFNEDYVITTLSFKTTNYFPELKYIHSENFEEFRFSVSYIFE